MRGSAYTGLRCTNCCMEFEAGALVSTAAFAALPHLYDEGILDPSNRVVVIATGTGLKPLGTCDQGAPT